MGGRVWRGGQGGPGGHGKSPSLSTVTAHCSLSSPGAGAALHLCQLPAQSAQRTQ